jgi:CRISPR-associated protein Cas2
MNPVMLIYDIEHDGKRHKIAEACKDYGLDRIQYSAFVGSLSANHAEELMLQIKHLLGNGRGNIQLIYIAQKDWDNRMEVAHD